MPRRFALAALAGMSLATGAPPALAACKLDTFAELPVTMTDLRPMVVVKINGGDARFAIDSGAFYSTMSPAAAAQFGLKLERPSIDLLGVGGISDASMTTVRQFGIAGGQLKNVAFVVPSDMMGGSVDGWLGQNLLGIADVEYDFGDGVVRLMRPSGCGSRDLAYWLKTNEPYGQVDLDPPELRSPHTVGRATVNGIKIKVLFDTGAPNSVLTLAAARRVGIASATMVDAGASGGVGRRIVRDWVAPVSSFEIGGEKIEHTRLRIADMSGLDADMLIGADFFLSHRVYVANSQNKLYFTYNGGPVFNLTTTTAPPSAGAPAPPPGSTPGGVSADASIYARRGAALASRRQFAAAIADFSKAIELAPKEPAYLNQRGHAYMFDGQVAKAMTDFNAALALDPNEASVRIARAELAGSSPDKAKAVEDLDVAARVLAKQADDRLILAALYDRAGALPAAIGQYDLWIESHRNDPRRVGAFNGRCWARALLGGDLDEALADCNAALKLAPGSFHILDSRGLVRLRRGEYDLAIADYDAVLAVAPRTAWSLYGRGLARLKQGKSVEGAADLAAAHAVDPGIAAKAETYGLKP